MAHAAGLDNENSLSAAGTQILQAYELKVLQQRGRNIPAFQKNVYNFDKIKGKLTQLELEIQQERNVPIWSSMFELIIESNAASHYV